MFQIPQVRRQEKTLLFEALFVFLLVIIILASFAVFVYWYIFGDANPFDKKSRQAAELQKNLYSNPKYRLSGIILQKAGK